MLNQRPKLDVVEKFKSIRAIYDKVFISIGGSLWIFSTLWDIYKLQRFWLDYTIEFYSSFFIFCMIIFSINPKSLPKIIYNNFRILTTIRGRGTFLIIISSLFLSDKHAFHKSCAIILFIGGVLYFICEILVPTTKEELEQIESIYNKTTENRNVKITQITDSTTNDSKLRTDQSTAIFNKENSEVINNNIETKNDLIKDINKENSNNEEIEPKKENKDIIDEEKNEKKIEENDSNNNNIISEEIVQKTDNPYEIPDDF
jgi:hypothetical protein